jgi:hypothetical protein
MLPLKRRCLTVVLLTVSLSCVSILASYNFVTFSIEQVPDLILYSYLTTLRNLTGLYWYFNFAVLSCAAAGLEDSLSKVREGLHECKE